MDQPHATSKPVTITVTNLETTYDLLEATMPSIKSPDTNQQKTLYKSPWSLKLESGKTPSPYVCPSEDEIFFGTPTEKELNGKSAKYNEKWIKTKNGRRKTLEIDSKKWREIRDMSLPEESENEDEDLPAIIAEPVTKEQQDMRNVSPDHIQITAKEIEDSDKVDAENEMKFQHLLTPAAVSDAESSIIDVNNDQMFDDTVFTEYDDMNISQMTQKMSANWRNKFKKEERAEGRRKRDNLSLDELVEHQTDKNCRNDDSNESKYKDMHNVTDNRRQRKPLDRSKKDFRLSSSDLVCTTMVNETPPSASTSMSGGVSPKTGIEIGIITQCLRNKSMLEESLGAKCTIGPKNYDTDDLKNSKQPTINEEGKESEIMMPPEQSSPNEDIDNSNLSTCSDWFNTTRDEMILYEKFGEEYDIIVEKMTKEEKIKLKKEVSEASPKEAEELLGKNKIIPETCRDNESTNPESKEEKMSSLSCSKTTTKQTPNVSVDRYTEISNSFTSDQQKSGQLEHMNKSSEPGEENLNPVTNYVIDGIGESEPYVNDNKNQEDENGKYYKDSFKSTSTSLESLGEEIKTTAEKNKCLQDLERSNNSNKCNTLDEDKHSEDRFLFGIQVLPVCEDRFHTVNDNALIVRVQKAQEELRKDRFVHENAKSSSDIQPTPVRNHQKEKIFETPDANNFKFKSPTSGKTGQSTGRTATYSSGDRFGTKINYGGGKSYVPSYQRDTVASTFERSPVKNKNKSTPNSGNIFPSPLDDFGSKRGLPSSVVDMDKIISPIAQYINGNPVPPLMKHIRPKTSKFLDAEIKASLQDQNMPSPKSTQAPKKIFAPLPAAKYCSSKVAIQIPVAAPNSDPKELPKAFGITNTVQATVVKHVLRTKVPRNLPQEEIIKATENMKPISPNAIQLGIPTMHQRESILLSRESNIGGTTIDQSTMEMSLQETREIKKPTTATLERKLH